MIRIDTCPGTCGYLSLQEEKGSRCIYCVISKVKILHDLEFVIEYLHGYTITEDNQQI